MDIVRVSTCKVLYIMADLAFPDYLPAHIEASLNPSTLNFDAAMLCTNWDYCIARHCHQKNPLWQCMIYAMWKGNSILVLAMVAIKMAYLAHFVTKSIRLCIPYNAKNYRLRQ